MSVHAISLALKLRGVSPSEKLVLLVLANYADESNRSFPSHRLLAAETGLSERTVLTVMKALETKKLVIREERRRPDGSRSSDMITLCYPGETISPRGENSSVGVGKPFPQGGETVSPLTTFEPSLNRQEEPTEANASAPSTSNDPDAKAWEDVLGVLVGQGSMTAPKARAFFGGLLKAHGLQPRDMLGPIGEAFSLRTKDPQGYLKACATARQKRQTGPPKRVGWV